MTRRFLQLTEASPLSKRGGCILSVREVYLFALVSVGLEAALCEGKKLECPQCPGVARLEMCSVKCCV